MARWALVALLLLAAGCARQPEPLRTDPGVSADWSGAETVNVTLTEFEFAPSELHFRQNQLCRLHLQDGAGDGYSFSAPKFFVTINQIAGKVVGASDAPMKHAA